MPKENVNYLVPGTYMFDDKLEACYTSHLKTNSKNSTQHPGHNALTNAKLYPKHHHPVLDSLKANIVDPSDDTAGCSSPVWGSCLPSTRALLLRLLLGELATWLRY